MAAFPAVRYDWRDLSQGFEPLVVRAPMERGLPKQRRVNSDALVVLELTVHFDTLAEAEAFETWFFTQTGGGAGFFDFTPPQGGAVVQARVVGGELGALTYKQRTLQASQRSLRVEWTRPAL